MTGTVELGGLTGHKATDSNKKYKQLNSESSISKLQDLKIFWHSLVSPLTPLPPPSVLLIRG